jgi:hypothetical protein
MTARNFRDLIDSYLSRQIELLEFATRFETGFHNREELGPALFAILNDVFEAEDSCWDPTVTPERETSTNITEATLLVELSVAVARLDVYIASGATA